MTNPYPTEDHPPDPHDARAEEDAERSDAPEEALRTIREAIKAGCEALESGDSFGADAEFDTALQLLDDSPPPSMDVLLAAVAEADRKELRVIANALRPLRVTTDLTDDPRLREWVAPQWLPSGRVALLTGAGGGGKSLLAMQLAAAVATGNRRPFSADEHMAPRLDSSKKRRVVFASWEDETSELVRRLAAIGVDRAAMGDRFAFVDMAGRGPIWGPQEGKHRDTTGSLTLAGKKLERLIRRTRPALVVIDPTAAAFAGSENDRAAVRAWLSHLGRLAADAKPAILLIAHPPKDTAHAFSGSTDWRGGVRSLWTLGPEDVSGLTGAPDKKGTAKGQALTLDKSNYAKNGRRAWLRLRVEGGDSTGALPQVMRWEEVSKTESAEAYHAWKGWDSPEAAEQSRAKGAAQVAPETKVEMF